MGYRLHVRKINHVEYADGVFNNMGDSIIPMLYDFPGDHWVSDDEERMEINKDDFREGIAALKKMTEKEFKEKYPRVVMEMTKEKCISTLTSLLEEADPDQDVVSLDWF